MAKRWSVTSLVALALLGCLVGTEVEAQDSRWQKPVPSMAKGAPPPQAQQELSHPQMPQVQPPQQMAPQDPQWSQWPQVQPPPQQIAPQYPQRPQVQPPPQQIAPQYPQRPQVQPPPQQPQYPQRPQVPPPTQQKAPQYPQRPQVQPPTTQHKAPQYPQYPQRPQVQPPTTQQKAPQYPQRPQVQPPTTQQKVPQYPQRPQVQLPTTQQKVPQYPQRPQPSVPLQPSFQSCEVAVSQKVPCGSADISAAGCEAISCCFNGQQCYFGKAVTVQCTMDAQFIVVVARDATLPNIDLESISLLGQGQGCTHVDSNSGFAIYNFPVTSCGSLVMEEPGVIIYENRMSASYEVGVGPLGVITRDSHFELLFQCRYTGTSVETVVAEVLPLLDPPLPVAAMGPISVHLRLANGQCNSKGCNEVDMAYSSFYTEDMYPVTKILREAVYVEVELLGKTDPNLVLTLDRCWVTTSPIPHNLPQWDILIDGCPYSDDRYLSSLVSVGPSSGLDFPSHYRRFLFKMFTFVDPNSMVPLKEELYIHCSTVVCSPVPGYSCEPSCFRKRRAVMDERQRTTEPKVVASVGPVNMSASAE
ncbi:zona pellucida sperm-binding protein 4-like [Anoplopoma fimbria]|uniref:zona pellucida sperm-binding protein 4-like n=1 Tax=Anoplopoma fimbria TaxID=229290 RepID=UPI0023ED3F47|nr:zona pellucida sperm-binding protein 4-like [Anoplopoma fimbria]